VDAVLKVAMCAYLQDKALVALEVRFLCWAARVSEHSLAETLTWNLVDLLARVLAVLSRLLEVPLRVLVSAVRRWSNLAPLLLARADPCCCRAAPVVVLAVAVSLWCLRMHRAAALS
jgi:hypothetical protein